MPGAYIFGWDATNEVWVKCLVNAEGKLIIDPSEIFENAPTDNEHGKAPDSDWAHDHGADSNAHHTHNYFSGSHDDLIDVAAADHHARYTDAEAQSLIDTHAAISDAHHAQIHAASHEKSGGADEISVSGLSGILADKQDPQDHGSRHKDGGGDELDASELAGALGSDGQVLKTDGAAASWEDPAGGVGAGSVGQSELKTSTGSVSVYLSAGSEGVTPRIPGGQFGFGYRVKASTSDVIFKGLEHDNLPNYYVRPKGLFNNSDYGSGHRGYLHVRYVTSSGEVYWIFLLRERGEIIKTYQAPDHPCFGNSGDPDFNPHPFPDFDPAKHEILVINPRISLMKEIFDKTPKGKDLLETLFEQYEIDESVQAPWPQKQVTVDLHHNDFPFYKPGSAKVIKRQIPMPDYIRTAGLKRK